MGKLSLTSCLSSLVVIDKYVSALFTVYLQLSSFHLSVHVSVFSDELVLLNITNARYSGHCYVSCFPVLEEVFNAKTG